MSRLLAAPFEDDRSRVSADVDHVEAIQSAAAFAPAFTWALQNGGPADVAEALDRFECLPSSVQRLVLEARQ